MFLPKEKHKALLGTALFISLIPLVLTIWVMLQFDYSASGYQFVLNMPWYEAIHSSLHLGVDGISMPLILLTTFITVLVVIAAAVLGPDNPALEA